MIPYSSVFGARLPRNKHILKKKLKALRNKNRALRTQLVRANQHLEIEMQKRKNPDSDDKSLLDIKRTKAGKQLTLEGSFAVGIRRNFSNIATADLGAVLLEDISRFTVVRSECRTGSALIASARMWFAAIYSEICDARVMAGKFGVCIHSYKQDATNSGILKGSKLAALILRSAYLKCAQELPEEDPRQTYYFVSRLIRS